MFRVLHPIVIHIECSGNIQSCLDAPVLKEYNTVDCSILKLCFLGRWWENPWVLLCSTVLTRPAVFTDWWASGCWSFPSYVPVLTEKRGKTSSKDVSLFPVGEPNVPEVATCLSTCILGSRNGSHDHVFMGGESNLWLYSSCWSREGEWYL